MKLPQEVEKAWQTLSAALPPEQAMDSMTPSTSRDPKILRAAEEAARGLAPLLQAAILVYVDELDRAHTIAQVFDTPEAAYWHGFMHRREGDYPNAKYWFRRAGALPQSLGQDPAAVTDRFAKLGRKDDPSEPLQHQRAEWLALFEHCAQGAT